MSMMQKRAVVFVAVLAVLALLAWVSGFNFDERSPDVAVGTFAAIFFAVLIAGGTDLFWESKP